MVPNVQADMEKFMSKHQREMPTVYECGKCHEGIGELIQLQGKIYLQVGKARLYSYHGVCECGRPVHFDSSEYALKTLIERHYPIEFDLYDDT